MGWGGGWAKGEGVTGKTGDSVASEALPEELPRTFLCEAGVGYGGLEGSERRVPTAGRFGFSPRDSEAEVSNPSMGMGWDLWIGQGVTSF